MATPVQPYGGSVPDRQNNTKESFAQNIYDLFLWIANTFTGGLNDSVVSINDDVATINTYKSDAQASKEDAQQIKEDTQQIKDSVIDIVNYKGDWASVVSYFTGDSVSYSDGNIYVSKIDNNTAEPVSGVTDDNWLFKSRVTYVYSTITTDYTAVNKDFLYVDTLTTGAITVTLPATPLENDTIGFLDIQSNLSTNPLSIARNGNTIMGLAEDMIVDTDNISFELVFTNNDWRIK